MSKLTEKLSSPVGASSSSSSSSSSSALPPVFIPPTDHAAGTWLSLGSYEEVFNSDWDYWAIHKALKQDCMTLVKILRIHNNLLKDRLDEELILVKKGRRTDFDPNIQDLYHGTSESLERICHEGLDERLSISGHFGRGIYFSDRPGICRIQSEINSPKQPFIVRCRVILGDCKVYRPGESDPALTREPIKDVINGKNVFYGSVQGKTGDFNQFVVYEKRRAMIQYIIYYTTDAALPSLPPIPRSESKSSSRKKKTASERRSSQSSLNETPGHSVSEDTRYDSGRSSSPSGSEKSLASAPSSDGNTSDDEDSSQMGAVGGRRIPRDPTAGKRSKRKNPSPQERPDQTSVQTVKSIRNRTRRLMSGGDAPSNAASSSSVNAASSSSVNTASSSSVSTAVIADHSSIDAYKIKMQETAMKQMLDLKGRVPPNKINELWEDYSRTYGSGMFGGIEDNFPPSVLEENDDVNAVIDVMVEEFKLIFPHVDSQTAHQYIIQNEMDIDKAVAAYLDNS